LSPQPRDLPSPAIENRPARTWAPSNARLAAFPDVNSPPDADDGDGSDDEYKHGPSEETVRMSITLESVLATASKIGGSTDPGTHKEAMALPEQEARRWRESEIDEFKSHEENNTFGPPVDLPQGFRAIPTALVFKTKRCGRRKVRVVIRGYRMMAGLDFNETFAPVARVTSFRILLAIAANKDWELVLGDVKTAFLASKMDTEVYITLPPAFNNNKSLNLPDRNSVTFHRLNKGVPGIPQGSHLFNLLAHDTLTKLGFVRASDDYCLYVHLVHPIMLALWVDDILFAYDKVAKVAFDNIIAQLSKKVDLKTVDNPQDMLGVRVLRNRERRTLTLDQSAFAEALLAKASMSKCNAVDTPVPAKTIFTKADCPKEGEPKIEDSKWYRSILATLIYLVLWTRVDLAFIVSKLCKFMQNPGELHVQFLKRVLRYLKGTYSRGLIYDFSNKPARQGVYGFYDASHADDVDTRRSTMSYVFFYSGCLISWRSKLHSYVTLSTNNSEYCASAKAAREAKWLWKIFRFLKLAPDVSPIALFGDSTGSIAMNYNPVQHDANKHCDIADHYARELVEAGIITITYVNTKLNLSDALTKALPTTDFERLISMVMTFVGV
jgi:hypothetical protein